MKKRILALVLSVAMVLGAVSFTAFADTTATTTDPKFFTVPETSESATIRIENGENFYVFDGNTFVDDTGAPTTSNRFAATAALMDANADLTDLASSYIAIRMKLNDNSGAFDHFTSFLRIYFDTTQEGQTEFRVSKDANAAKAPKWLDLKDGSMINFRSINDSSTEQGYRFVGDMDGYLLINIPGSCNPDKVTEEYLKNYFSGIRFYFNYYNGTSTTTQLSSWEDKELLVGDSYIVKDAKAFQTSVIEKNNIVKYAPEGGKDGAYYALRIGGFHSTSYGTHGSAVGKYWGCATRPLITSNVQRTYLHYTTLPNGDRAAALKLNTESEYTVSEGVTAPYTAGGGAITMMDTYERVWSSDSSYRAIVAGIPDELDMTKMTAIAFRVATKDGSIENEPFNFAIDVRKNNPSSNRQVKKGYMAEGQVTYFDANTGASQKLTVKADGTIDVTGNLDGYIIVPFTGFTNDFFTDTADVQANWGGHYNPFSQEKLPGTTTTAPSQYDTSAEVIGFDLNSGFANGKTLYIGDCLFLEDAAKFQTYHCPHSSWTAGTVVAPTCKAGGYTPYTCDGCGKLENRDETAIIDHDKLGGELEAKAPTCKEEGFSAAKLCSMCGEVSEKSAPVPVIPCDKNVDYPAKAPTCKEAGNEAGKKCSMCGEITEGGATLAPIACNTSGGDIAAKAPTCKEAGNEAGKKCSMCGEISEGGATLAIIAHNKDKDVPEVKATCKEKGTTAGKACTMCGEVQEGCEEIAIAAHNKDKDVAEVPATCTKEGTTAGKACSMCGEVQEGCEKIDMIDHDLEKIETVKPTTTEKGYDILKCKDCDYTENDNFVDELEEEEEEEKSPETGDNNAFAVVMMLVALGAATVLFASRKRARR